jgi:hypothetical protein
MAPTTSYSPDPVYGTPERNGRGQLILKGFGTLISWAVLKIAFI